MYKKSLEINEKLGLQEGSASIYGNLGIVLQIRGDLDGAEEMHKKSLEIDEKLGRLEGIANQYGNLGIVLQTRGDLDGAEEMYKKASAEASTAGSSAEETPSENGGASATDEKVVDAEFEEVDKEKK